jgi:hypothetical protein
MQLQQLERVTTQAHVTRMIGCCASYNGCQMSDAHHARAQQNENGRSFRVRLGRRVGLRVLDHDGAMRRDVAWPTAPPPLRLFA